jgi:hypothetical protein
MVLEQLCGRTPCWRHTHTTPAHSSSSSSTRLPHRTEQPNKGLPAPPPLAPPPQVHVKASAFFRVSQQPYPHLDACAALRRLVDVFGARRVMWGSDCPWVLEQCGWVQLVLCRAALRCAVLRCAALRCTALRCACWSGVVLASLEGTPPAQVPQGLVPAG